MARRAIRDTFGVEKVGDVEVRRRVVAGQRVPDHYEVDEKDLEDKNEARTLAGYKDRQRTKRVTVEGDRVVDHHKSKAVGRIDSAADRPTAEGEPERADEHGLVQPDLGEKSSSRKSSAKGKAGDDKD